MVKTEDNREKQSGKKGKGPRGGKRFVKGQSGNPKGRTPMPLDLRTVKEMTPSFVKKVIAKLAEMTREEMDVWVESGKLSNLERMVASIIVKATVEGDHNKLSFLLDRTIGKVVEQRRLEIQAVKYITKVNEDGALLQEVVQAELAGDCLEGVE